MRHHIGNWWRVGWKIFVLSLCSTVWKGAFDAASRGPPESNNGAPRDELRDGRGRIGAFLYSESCNMRKIAQNSPCTWTGILSRGDLDTVEQLSEALSLTLSQEYILKSQHELQWETESSLLSVRARWFPLKTRHWLICNVTVSLYSSSSGAHRPAVWHCKKEVSVPL